jgi:hypothetical protein
VIGVGSVLRWDCLVFRRVMAGIDLCCMDDVT